MEKSFRFYVPLNTDQLIKSVDQARKDNTPMKVSGIASTIAEDSDGETLDPDGFDYEYLLTNGFINWHHQSKTDPSAIIGEPTKAYVKNKEFHIEAELYPWSETARKVYAIAQSLAKGKGKRQLGWSIEGKATERIGPFGDKLAAENYDSEVHKGYTKVSKARITGVAITPMPKNASTIVDIMKGNRTGYENENSLEQEIIDLQKSNPNGGEWNILEVSQPDGTKIVVDKNLNVKICKALTTDAGSGGALKKESVEKRAINLTDMKGAAVLLQKAKEAGMIRLSPATRNQVKEKFEIFLGDF